MKLDSEIESAFRALFLGEDTHKFLLDMEKVKEVEANILKDKKAYYKRTNRKFPKQIFLKDPLPTVTSKSESVMVGTDNIVHKHWNKLEEATSWEDVVNILQSMNRYTLPSTISVTKYIKKIKKEADKHINVLIVGAGPAGLFLANYLHTYYNSSPLAYPKVNILVVESRVEKEGIKSPYSRNRVFAFGSKYLALLFVHLYCYEDRDNPGYVLTIKLLETLLYMQAFRREIPMRFTKKYLSWNKIKQLAKEMKAHVLFDCTGGKLDHKLFTSKQSKSWLSNLKLSNSTYRVEQTHNNLMRLVWKSRHPRYKVYCAVTFRDKNFMFVNYNDWMLDDPSDVAKLQKYHGKDLTIQNIRKLFRTLSDPIDRVVAVDEQVKYGRVNLFQADIRHALKVTKQINKHTLYVGMGDTIFHSHFTTGAGLNRLFDFSARICGYLPLLLS